MTKPPEKIPQPPRWATFLLRKYTNPELAEEIEGDLAEAFQDVAAQKSVSSAKLSYVVNVLRFICPFSSEHPREHYPKASVIDMLTSYLKLSSRYLFKHKAFTLMNIMGLAVGLAACMAIFFYVRFELNYDTFHQHADRIFRVSAQINSGESEDQIAPTANGVAITLKEQYPEVEEAARFIPTMAIIKTAVGEVFSEGYFFKADPEVFKIFSYPMLAGNPEEALKNPHSVVLTKAMANKYFANIDYQQLLGKSLTINSQPYQVTGVVKNLPENSDLLFDALLSWQFNSADNEQWMDFGSYTYLLLHDQESSKTLAQKLSAFDKEFDDRIVKEWGISYLTVHHYLHPLTSLHYNNTLMGDTEHKGNRSYIYIFSCIAVFILMIACINYINFAVAQASGRAVEAGVRKTAGARQKQLWLQYMSESFIVTGVALLTAIVLVQLAGKHFTHLTGPGISSDSFFQSENLVLLE